MPARGPPEGARRKDAMSRPMSSHKSSNLSREALKASVKCRVVGHARSDLLPVATTTTSKPAQSRASTTGPSGRSIATRSTWWVTSRLHSSSRPGPLWSTSNSSTRVPAWSTTAIAWASVAQSTPPKRNVSFSMSASSLIAQWGSTRWSKDVSAGRSLIGALGRSALLPVGASWAAGPRTSHCGGRTASDNGNGPAVTRGASPSSAITQWWSSERR